MFKMCCGECGECWWVGNARACKCPDEQPKREWVGLTEAEQDKVFKTFSKSDAYKRDFLNRVASAIEAKLKEKNT
jgi:hypothetical protein